MLRKIAGLFIRVGNKINSLAPEMVEKPDPSLYSTTDEPMEVPCQKETYFGALNKYINEGDRVLDVGHGIGYGINLLSIKASELYGVDVDAKAVDFVKKNVLGKNPKLKEVQHYDGYNLPYRNNFFDVVTCIDVLEHVEEYDRFLDELLRVAKRVVMIGTPNRRPEHTDPDGTPKNPWHLREWSYEELNEIMNRHKAKTEWQFINGPWDGPFTISEKIQEDTMALAPALVKKA